MTNFFTMPDNLSQADQFLSAIIILAVINLWCFLDIIGFLIALYLVKYTDVEKKYPKYKKWINYYNNANFMSIGIEILFILFIHFLVIGASIAIYIK
jgi:hypothetical protein